ncbi:MAG: 7TM domain-containing protein [Candidatus Shapirobacteria bacterium]
MLTKKLVLFLALFFLFALPAGAVTIVPNPSLEPQGQESTASAIPTTVAVKENITEPKNIKTKGKLEALLDEQNLGPLSLDNFLKYSVRFAVSRGVPANTIILILLLPLVGALVGAVQYGIGVPGFGIFMPAMIAITFLATGIVGGLFLFAVILISTVLAGRSLKKVKIFYWPRRAITLMIISLITFGFLAVSPSLSLLDLTQISIFPILFLILLSEEFTRVQLGKSKRSAMSLTIGTLVISILGASLMAWEKLQELVLLNPELSFLAVLVLNLLIGKYTGWRLLEHKRFKAVLER